MNLKFTEGLRIMAMKNDTKFEEELTCHFKTDTTTWWILTIALKYLKNVHFSGLLLTKGMFGRKTIMFGLKNTEELCLIVLKIHAKFEGELSCAFQNDMRDWKNFHNSDFILERKMEELNQNKNLKQLDGPDAVRKLYFTLELKE